MAHVLEETHPRLLAADKRKNDRKAKHPDTRLAVVRHVRRLKTHHPARHLMPTEDGGMLSFFADSPCSLVIRTRTPYYIYMVCVVRERDGTPRRSRGHRGKSPEEDACVGFFQDNNNNKDIQNTMNMEAYESPKVEMIEVEVEQGFAGSSTTEGYQNRDF